MTQSDAYQQLQCYSLEHGGAEFIHQHVVDAGAAQNVQPGDKPIGIVFALAGLCLHVEYGHTGKQVQSASPGADRDQMISQWCSDVWQAFAPAHQTIRNLLQQHRIVPPPR